MISNCRKRSRISKRICKLCNKKRKSNSTKHKTGDHCCCHETTADNTEPILSLPPPSTADILSDNKGNAGKIVGEIPNKSLPYRSLYESHDAAPFIVHITKTTTSPDQNLTLHPVTFGSLLKKVNFENVVNGSLKKIGRNKLSLSFSNYKSANNFLLNEYIKSQNYKVFIPSSNIIRMGIIRGVPKEWLPEDIIENISVPVGCGNILKVRRLKRKIVINNIVKFEDTETVVLTIDGQILPKRVFMCYTAMPVDLYIFPTIQCYNCCRYGHIKDQCRSKPRCFKCGNDHSGSLCLIDDDDVHCCNCKGHHYATDKKCPEFERQKSIKISMAQNCISYPEASKLHPTVSNSYANVVKHSLNTQPENCSTSSQNVTKSYRKTVYSKPHSLPKFSKGYDRFAHNNLIRENAIPEPNNGCALINREDDKETTNNESISNLILNFIKSLFNNSSPSNAAVLNEIYEIIIKNQRQNRQNFTVEL